MFHKRSRQGFTLVEVIVVAVIVAILSAVAVPLYLGYINSSKVSTANNIAGSAASFIAAAKNAGATTLTGVPGTITSASTPMSFTPDGGEAVTFKLPDTSASIVVTGSMAAGGTVVCTYKSKTSTAYNF